MKLLDILQVKGHHVHTITPKENILSAAQKLVNNGVGALIVMDNLGRLMGIITERDILRLSAQNASLNSLRVEQCMTHQLITANTEATVDEAQAVMTERRIRHLPVVENGILEGIVSQGDLVKAKLDAVQHEAYLLTNFVTGKYPA
jgi:CBS domain-containing protein